MKRDEVGAVFLGVFITAVTVLICVLVAAHASSLNNVYVNSSSNVLGLLGAPGLLAALAMSGWLHWHRACKVPCVHAYVGEHPVSGTTAKVCNHHHTLEHHRKVFDMHKVEGRLDTGRVARHLSPAVPSRGGEALRARSTASAAFALVLCGNRAGGGPAAPSTRAHEAKEQSGRPARRAGPRSTVLVRFAAACRSSTSTAARPSRTRSPSSAAHPDVVYAEPNAIVHAAGLAAPDDPQFASQWALARNHALAGWSLFPGSYAPAATPTIAIVDTGIDSTHEDLAAGIDTADAAVCLNYLDSCVSGQALDTDPTGHGTHVAGIAGALADNGTGIAGVAFASPLMPVKVLHADETGTVAAVASGIAWAAARGALRVINLGLATTSFSQTLCDAVTAATAAGARVVAAAGNAASGLGTAAPSYPASCPGAVGVTMTGLRDESPAISNIGFPNAFVSAPGVNVVSTLRFDTYGSLTGTSTSTALVSGLAALLFAQHPERTPDDVRRVLARTAAKVGGVAYGADPFHECAGQHVASRGQLRPHRRTRGPCRRARAARHRGDAGSRHDQHARDDRRRGLHRREQGRLRRRAEPVLDRFLDEDHDDVPPAACRGEGHDPDAERWSATFTVQPAMAPSLRPGARR